MIDLTQARERALDAESDAERLLESVGTLTAALLAIVPLLDQYGHGDEAKALEALAERLALTET